jgi:hypothetical protein
VSKKWNCLQLAKLCDTRSRLLVSERDATKVPLSAAYSEQFGHYVRYCKTPLPSFSRAKGSGMPQALECKRCGELMELRTVPAPYPADDEHFFRCPHCYFVVRVIPKVPATATPK